MCEHPLRWTGGKHKGNGAKCQQPSCHALKQNKQQLRCEIGRLSELSGARSPVHNRIEVVFYEDRIEQSPRGKLIHVNKSERPFAASDRRASWNGR